VSAAETIQAAIDKLETQRAASTTGPWIVHDMGDSTYTSANNKGWWWIWQESALPFYGGVMEVDHRDDFGPGGSPVGVASRTDNDDGEKERADADLIVTLHRTIDPQLAILRESHHRAADEGRIVYNDPAVELARAILGEDA